jgi:hypothetical protein
MKRGERKGDIESMSAAAKSPAHARRPDLLIADCAGVETEERPPIADRLRQLIGPDLTRLLLVALAGDHRMSSRDRAA